MFAPGSIVFDWQIYAVYMLSITLLGSLLTVILPGYLQQSMNQWRIPHQNRHDLRSFTISLTPGAVNPSDWQLESDECGFSAENHAFQSLGSFSLC
jgi:hypothetical protein